MLTKIREKAQGVFAWVILILICVPFALWGIQNYLNVGKETPVATVGGHEFFQRDLNKAYAQYSQNLAGRGIDEATIKKLALEKLVSDEVLLQYAQQEGLVIADDNARKFIQSLQYFQVDGKFDKKQYQVLLNSQKMSSAEFVSRIRKALIMEQFQKSIVGSAFVTKYEVDSFFKIQNQLRDVEYVQIELPQLTELPTDDTVKSYYQQHQDDYRTPEQVSIEYIELALDDLAKTVEPTEEQLEILYSEQKDTYTTKEQRKVSHILFAFSADAEQDKAALERALQAKQRLATEAFSALADELSDDKSTAKNGGDLGLFNVGDMEPVLEEAIVSLQEGQVSEPVKSAFGYHLLKITELSPGSTKPFSEVKDKVREAYQISAAENTYYELGETLTEVSYENSDNLDTVAEEVGIEVKKSELFTSAIGTGIAAEQAIRDAAFSEDVLKGNNSDPIELGSDRLVVLRTLEHQQAAVKPLEDVRKQVEAAILSDQAKKLAAEQAEQILQRLQAGESLQTVANDEQLELQKFPALKRDNSELPWQLSKAIFKAAKPLANQPTDFVAALPLGAQAVVSLLRVTEGELSAEDRSKLDIAENNLAQAFAQSAINSVLSGLQANTDVSIKNVAQ